MRSKLSPYKIQELIVLFFLDSGDDTDPEMNEWENQQIRKGVTGAQLITAQQESIYSQYMIKNSNNTATFNSEPLSTGNLLEQAYARISIDKQRKIVLSTQKQSTKVSGPRMPEEVAKKLNDRLLQVRELHDKHILDIDQITKELKVLKMEELDCSQKAPIAAIKYQFYQELRGYVTDLVECLDEKVRKRWWSYLLLTNMIFFFN